MPTAISHEYSTAAHGGRPAYRFPDNGSILDKSSVFVTGMKAMVEFAFYPNEDCVQPNFTVTPGSGWQVISLVFDDYGDTRRTVPHYFWYLDAIEIAYYMPVYMFREHRYQETNLTMEVDTVDVGRGAGAWDNLMPRI